MVHPEKKDEINVESVSPPQSCGADDQVEVGAPIHHKYETMSPEEEGAIEG